MKIDVKKLIPFSPLERMIAWRYLRPRRKEGFISVISGFSFLGIALGVATLIIVMSVMNGFRQELMTRILGFNSHLVAVGVTGRIPDFDQIAKKLESVPGVIEAVPVINGQVMATFGRSATGAYVKGIRAADLKAQSLITNKIVRGSLDNFKGEDVVMIGRRMSVSLGVDVGQRIRLISPEGTTTPFGTMPRTRTYRVAAIFSVGMSEYDSLFVFMPLKAAQIFFRKKGVVGSIEMRVENPDKVESVAQALVPLKIPNVRYQTWQDRHATFFSALRVERNVMFLILTLIIVVAAFNIISSLIMLVKDKTQAVAILRTMGATRSTIMRIFFMSGASIGFFGTLFGVGLGVAIADNIDSLKKWLEEMTGNSYFPAEIYFLSRLPAIINPMEVLQVAAMGLGLSFLATLYPSWRAARLDPVEALRYE